jgi:hypothetical protein
VQSEPQPPADPSVPTTGASDSGGAARDFPGDRSGPGFASDLSWIFVAVAALGALAHFVAVPVLHGVLRDRGIDRAEDVQSLLAFFAFLLGAVALFTGSIRLIFFGEETGPNLVYGLRSAVAGIAPAIVLGGVGTFSHLAPPLVATLYGAVAAASLGVAGGLALRRPSTRGLGFTVLAIALAALFRLAAQKAAVVSGVRALQSLYTVAVVLAGGATLFFAAAVVLAVLTQRRAGKSWKIGIIHGGIASGLAVAWAGLRGLGDHASPPLVGLAIGLDGALVGPHAGALLVMGRLMAPLGIFVGSAFVLLALPTNSPAALPGERSARVALAAVLLSGARFDAPLGAILALVAAFAAFAACDGSASTGPAVAKVDWNAMLAKRGAGPTE